MDAPVADLLEFWFGADRGDDVAVAERQRQLWWAKDDAVDADIRRRFEPLLQRVSSGALDAWQGEPRGALAFVLLTDQLPRNIYRGTPRAFDFDGIARSATHAMLARGDDVRLAPIERVFAYLPLEHSEARADQALSVQLFEALAREVPEAMRGTFEGYADYARRHAQIVYRFGRFPHRNAVMRRPSSAEEAAFLRLPGSGF